MCVVFSSFFCDPGFSYIVDSLLNRQYDFGGVKALAAAASLASFGVEQQVFTRFAVCLLLRVFFLSDLLRCTFWFLPVIHIRSPLSFSRSAIWSLCRTHYAIIESRRPRSHWTIDRLPVGDSAVAHHRRLLAALCAAAAARPQWCTGTIATPRAHSDSACGGWGCSNAET